MGSRLPPYATWPNSVRDEFIYNAVEHNGRDPESLQHVCFNIMPALGYTITPAMLTRRFLRNQAEVFDEDFSLHSLNLCTCLNRLVPRHSPYYADVQAIIAMIDDLNFRYNIHTPRVREFYHLCYVAYTTWRAEEVCKFLTRYSRDRFQFTPDEVLAMLRLWRFLGTSYHFDAQWATSLVQIGMPRAMQGPYNYLATLTKTQLTEIDAMLDKVCASLIHGSEVTIALTNNVDGTGTTEPNNNNGNGTGTAEPNNAETDPLDAAIAKITFCPAGGPVEGVTEQTFKECGLWHIMLKKSLLSMSLEGWFDWFGIQPTYDGPQLPYPAPLYVDENLRRGKTVISKDRVSDLIRMAPDKIYGGWEGGPPQMTMGMGDTTMGSFAWHNAHWVWQRVLELPEGVAFQIDGRNRPSDGDAGVYYAREDGTYKNWS